jgi:hypothetical protein
VTGIIGQKPWIIGDGEWQWVYHVEKITSIGTNPLWVTMYGLAANPHDAFYYAPMFMRIPVRTISDNEAAELGMNMGTWPEGIAVGSVSTLRGHQLCFGGSDNYMACINHTLSTNRSWTAPDKNGILDVGGLAQQSAYDNFDHSDGVLGANWSINSGSINTFSNKLVGAAKGARSAAFYSATKFDDNQFSEITYTGAGNLGWIGPSVRNGIAKVKSYYACEVRPSGWEMIKMVAGAQTILASGQVAFNVGDTIRIEAIGSTIICTRNDSVLTTQIDTALASGSPGVEVFDNSPAQTADNWTGGNLSLPQTLESDWTAPQRFLKNVYLSHVSQHQYNASRNDLAGTISVSSSTSGSYTFGTAYNVAPLCTVTPSTNPRATGVWWVTSTTTAVTAHLTTPGSITFNFHCIGNPD